MLVVYACNETNLMHYLSSVYSVTILLHVSGTASCPSSGSNNVYMWQLLRVVRLSRLSGNLDPCRPADSYPVPIVKEAVWAPGTVWAGAENLVFTGIRSPDRPARSESLYRLSYPGPWCKCTFYSNWTLNVQMNGLCRVTEALVFFVNT
jgi:hypothetical protein